MRIALLVLVAAGMAMCARGIGRVAAYNDWGHPFAVIGYILGTAALAFAFAGLFHRKIWFVTGEKQAVIAIALIIAAKFIVGAAYAYLKK